MKGEYTSGLRDGLAIGVGYFSVSFTFGILAVNGGLSPLVAGLISLTNMTSAGQFAGLTVILAHGSLVELALTQLVINLRYALMSLSLSQRLGPEFTTRRRMLAAFANTDEIFAVAMGRTAPLTPAYMYGLAALPILGWTGGHRGGRGGGRSALPRRAQRAGGRPLQHVHRHRGAAHAPFKAGAGGGGRGGHRELRFCLDAPLPGGGRRLCHRHQHAGCGRAGGLAVPHGRFARGR